MKKTKSKRHLNKPKWFVSNQASKRKHKKKPAPFQLHDDYFHKAKAEWYRARSVYKLKEIQEKFELITPEMNVCDVWAAPWSFIQYIKRIIKDNGQIVWIDLKPIDKYSQRYINTIVHSIFDFETLKPKVENFIWEWKRFDLITSDIAPNTTWRKDVDQYASVELNIAILEFADVFLEKWWNVLLKVFKWEDFNDLVQVIKKKYKKFTEYKPKACRDRSFEEYVICYEKK
jgi:23S rRNA (uridine2552-2'-O)-methyltransferase